MSNGVVSIYVLNCVYKNENNVLLLKYWLKFLISSLLISLLMNEKYGRNYV